MERVSKCLKMDTQLCLSLATASGPDLAARTADLVDALRGRGWLKSGDLFERGFTDRELREIVQHDASGQIFSFPGSPGYKLFDDVTEAEFDRCIALKNQGEKMIHRWSVYQRRHHRRMPKMGAER